MSATEVTITEDNWHSLDVSQLTPINEHWVPGSKKLFLFFGGLVGSIGMPPFEFYRAANILNDNKIFFRDVSQAWYQRGLPGIGENAHAIGDYLHSRIEQSGAEEIRFIGNSMGGYAALMFCAMLGRGKAIVFSPQTFICPNKRQSLGDERWPEKVQTVLGTQQASDIYDLKAWITSRHPTLSAQIYVSTEDALDTRHAEELRGFDNIHIHRYDEGGGHDLVRWLRQEGKLVP
jgi:predicted esterase YcpF (UPF0227 family)